MCFWDGVYLNNKPINFYLNFYISWTYSLCWPPISYTQYKGKDSFKFSLLISSKSDYSFPKMYYDLLNWHDKQNCVGSFQHYSKWKRYVKKAPILLFCEPELLSLLLRETEDTLPRKTWEWLTVVRHWMESYMCAHQIKTTVFPTFLQNYQFSWSNISSTWHAVDSKETGSHN